MKKKRFTELKKFSQKLVLGRMKKLCHENCVCAEKFRNNAYNPEDLNSRMVFLVKLNI